MSEECLLQHTRALLQHIMLEIYSCDIRLSHQRGPDLQSGHLSCHLQRIIVQRMSHAKYEEETIFK